MNWRYSFRLVTAGLVSVLVAWLLDFSTSGAMMILFFSMLAVGSTIGATLWLMKPMLLWSFLGVLVGLIVVSVFGPLITQHDWVIWVVMCGLAFYGAIVLPLHRLARLSLITALLILVMGMQTANPMMHALYRALYIVIALAISVIVSYLVFPQRAAPLLLKSIESIKEKTTAAFNEMMAALLEPTGAWSQQEMRERLIGIRGDIEQVHEQLGQVHVEGASSFKPKLRIMLLAQRRMLGSLFPINRLVENLRCNPMLQETTEEVKRLIEGVNHVVEGGENPDFDHLVNSIEDRLTIPQGCPVHQMAPYFYLLHALGSLGTNLVEMR